jgi:hypothetical protein
MTLEHFETNTPCGMPSGAGIQTRTNFLVRGWIVRTERLEDWGPELYAMTPKGLNALQCARNED